MIHLFTEAIARETGDIWDEKEHPCFVCSRPTRYLDLCWQGPICSNECDSWAMTESAYPKVDAGPRPDWKKPKLSWKDRLYFWIDERGRIPRWVRWIFPKAHWCPDMDQLLVLDDPNDCYCGIFKKG